MIVITAALVAFTCVWTLLVLRRLPNDVRLLRGDKRTPIKVAIAAVWGLTAILVSLSLGILAVIAIGIATWRGF